MPRTTNTDYLGGMLRVYDPDNGKPKQYRLFGRWLNVRKTPCIHVATLPSSLRKLEWYNGSIHFSEVYISSHGISDGISVSVSCNTCEKCGEQYWVREEA